MSNRFKNFIQALRARGYCIRRIDDYIWVINGVRFNIEELLVFGRKELKKGNYSLYNQLRGL